MKTEEKSLCTQKMKKRGKENKKMHREQNKIVWHTHRERLSNAVK